MENTLARMDAKERREMAERHKRSLELKQSMERVKSQKSFGNVGKMEVFTILQYFDVALPVYFLLVHMYKFIFDISVPIPWLYFYV